MQVSLWSVIDRGYIRAGQSMVSHCETLHTCRSVYDQSLIEATYVQVSLWSVIERLHTCRSVYGQSLRGYIRAGQSMVSH